MRNLTVQGVKLSTAEARKRRRDTPGTVFMVDVAMAAGVQVNTVHDWVRRNYPRVRRLKDGRRVMPAWLADQYLARTASGVTRGDSGGKWVPLKRLRLDTGFAPHTILRRAEEWGLRVEQRSGRLMMHPADAEYLKLRASDARPPTGWRSVASVAVEAGKHRSTVHRVAKRLAVQLREFKEPGGRFQLFMREADAEYVLSELNDSTAKTVPVAVVRRIRRLAFTGWKIQAISDLTGVPVGTISGLVVGRTRWDAGGPIAGVHYEAHLKGWRE